MLLRPARPNLGDDSGGRPIRIQCFGKTDVGRKRELNEDSLHFSDKDRTCLLADGMGGRDFGEVASSLAVSTLNTHLHKFFPKSLEGRRLAEGGGLADVIVQSFDGWIRDVNTIVYEFGAFDHRYREMGTTLALLYQQEDFVVVAHVGDSRVYRFRDGRGEQLTEDHSFVNAQVRSASSRASRRRPAATRTSSRARSARAPRSSPTCRCIPR